MQEIATGTQTAVINTEHTLATITDAGVYVLWVDLHNMAGGDTAEIRRKTKVLTGSTARTRKMDTFSGAQSADAANYESDPVTSKWSVAFTLKQTAGTGRAYDWSILRVDL